MHAYVRERLPQLYELCRKHKVKQLDLFGSGTGDRFDPSHSDLDFLVEFLPDAAPGLDGYFDFRNALIGLFGREVDIVEAGAVRSRYLREQLNETKEHVYAA